VKHQAAKPKEERCQITVHKATPSRLTLGHAPERFDPFASRRGRLLFAAFPSSMGVVFAWRQSPSGHWGKHAIVVWRQNFLREIFAKS
jgi:hypothetical protein